MLQEMKDRGDCPEFMTESGIKTLQGGYLRIGETPKDMYRRLAKTAAYWLKDDTLEPRFFEILWNGDLCPATPVASFFGTDAGLPISCNSVDVGDSLLDITNKIKETAILTKYGAGVGIHLGRLRGKGDPIGKDGGKSDGVVPFSKMFDSVIYGVAQSGVRRGSAALYLPVDHRDYLQFLGIRKPLGDANTRCPNIHQGTTIKDQWMEEMLSGDKHKKDVWRKILETRSQTGETYLSFLDTINNNNPKMYKDQGFQVVTSNLCNEIALHSDEDHTFTCCLSSLNLMNWERIKNSNTIELSIMFLDAVLSEYIHKASKIEGLENAVRSAEKSRALGLGVLGWHSLLQSRLIPFESFDAMKLNGEIFRTIKQKSDKASTELAVKYGEPEWCKGYGTRNTHKTAIAPTRSNSVISGGFSMGIEPIHFNLMVNKTAKGVFIEKNEIFFNHLSRYHPTINHNDVVNELIKSSGSVQGLKYLSPHEKEVFKNAREINQLSIVQQASQRQKFTDQGQSVNTFFTSKSSPAYINKVHIEAWRQGLKGLYYMRSTSATKYDGDVNYKECRSCEG